MVGGGEGFYRARGRVLYTPDVFFFLSPLTEVFFSFYKTKCRRFSSGGIYRTYVLFVFGRVFSSPVRSAPCPDRGISDRRGLLDGQNQKTPTRPDQNGSKTVILYNTPRFRRLVRRTGRKSPEFNQNEWAAGSRRTNTQKCSRAFVGFRPRRCGRTPFDGYPRRTA